MSYYVEAYPVLEKLFKGDKDAINKWLFTPNYLWNYFSPIALILTDDKRVMNWLLHQLEVKNGK